MSLQAVFEDPRLALLDTETRFQPTDLGLDEVSVYERMRGGYITNKEMLFQATIGYNPLGLPRIPLDLNSPSGRQTNIHDAVRSSALQLIELAPGVDRYKVKSPKTAHTPNPIFSSIAAIAFGPDGVYHFGTVLKTLWEEADRPAITQPEQVSNFIRFAIIHRNRFLEILTGENDPLAQRQSLISLQQTQRSLFERAVQYAELLAIQY